MRARATVVWETVASGKSSGRTGQDGGGEAATVSHAAPAARFDQGFGGEDNPYSVTVAA